MPRRDATIANPALVDGKTARAMLACRPTHLRDLGVRNILTVVWPNGPGRGKRPWYYPDEIDLWKQTRNPDEVRRFRKDMGRIEKPKRKGVRS